MFLTSFETNVSQNVKSGCINNQKFPSQHCFVPQFSKWLQHLLLQWLVAYTYHLTIASPPLKISPPPIGTHCDDPGMPTYPGEDSQDESA